MIDLDLLNELERTGQIMQRVRQAVRAEALAANPEAVRRLHNRIAAVALPPTPALAAALPALARSISGGVYEFPVNPSRSIAYHSHSRIQPRRA